MTNNTSHILSVSEMVTNTMASVIRVSVNVTADASVCSSVSEFVTDN